MTPEQIDQLIFQDPWRASRAASLALDSAEGTDRILLVAIWGSARRHAGKIKEAEKAIRFALQRSLKDSCSRGLIADIRRRLSYVELDKGRFQRALAINRDAIDDYLLTNNLPGVGKCFIDQGIYLCCSGQHEKALEKFLASSNFLDESDSRHRIASMGNSSVEYLHLGCVQESMDALQKADHLVTQFDSSRAIVGKLRIQVAEICLSIGEVEKAEMVAKAAAEGLGHEALIANLVWVRALCNLGKFRQAKVVTRESLKILGTYPSREAHKVFYKLLCAFEEGTVNDALLRKTLAGFKAAGNKKMPRPRAKLLL